MGSLARHLGPHDERIHPITLRILSSLNTPSHQVWTARGPLFIFCMSPYIFLTFGVRQVQDAVSNCLPPLVTTPAMEDAIPNIVNKLMKQLLTGEKYGERRVS